MSADKQERNARRALVGTVTGTKNAKTISVRVERMVMHPLYKKYMKRSSIYKAHDENSEAGLGDRVEIAETRRLSKTKCFRLVRIVAKARIPASTPSVAVLPEAEG